MHVHCKQVKGKRNLLYTGATRAVEQLKLSGFADEKSVREKMELHPKSIVQQAMLGSDEFSAERVEAAREEVERSSVGARHGGGPSTSASVSVASSP